jgi:acetate kinase
MGTRCGQLDAAVVLYLQQAHGMTPQAVTQLLFRESGLLGLSGISSDMRALQASPDPAAALAIDHFVEQVVQQLGRMVAALRGVDAIVFTGGIGENAAPLRARILAQCAWLGVDADAQPRPAGTGRLSGAGSAVAAWVLRTDEEAVIARHALRVLQAAGT